MYRVLTELQVKKLKLAIPAGLKAPKLVSNDHFHEHLSLAFAISAGGAVSTTMFIFSGAEFTQNALQNTLPGSLVKAQKVPHVVGSVQPWLQAKDQSTRALSMTGCGPLQPMCRPARTTPFC
jgi:hypothetical protein